jgi:elongation factor P--(R)-beta-lysine ligase
MAHHERDRLQRLRPVLELRDRMLAAIRCFFAARDFLAVQTPVRLPAPALEDYIDAEPAGDQWLRTSPELHMKRLLAAGYERIYQIGSCFRQGERGHRHLPAFTMLEWYRLHADHEAILADTIELVRQVLTATLGTLACPFQGQSVDFGTPWERLTVEDAFQRYAQADVDEAITAGEFEQVLVEQVEPHLGNGRPTVLGEYPLACSGLSRPIPGRPNRVERWELYVAGLELGNACSELTDPDEQAARFAACAELRRSEGRPVYLMDEPFMAALRAGMPPAAGIAIGLDRLLLILGDLDDLADTVAFP